MRAQNSSASQVFLHVLINKTVCSRQHFMSGTYYTHGLGSVLRVKWQFSIFDWHRNHLGAFYKVGLRKGAGICIFTSCQVLVRQRLYFKKYCFGAGVVTQQ